MFFVLCKNCAKQLQKAINEKNSRLKRKTSDFKALVASKNKIVDDKQFFLDKRAYDQLDILTRQEAEDISNRIITTFYKKSKKINKDKIDDFLNI